MRLFKNLFWILTGYLFYLSCSKPADQNAPQGPAIPDNPGTVKDSVKKVDSVFLLKSIRSVHGAGGDFDFTYDDSNKLSKIVMPSLLKFSFYIHYLNGKVSSVVAQAPTYNDKASMILLYGLNSKCSKIIFKNKVDAYVDLNSKYFTDLNDGKVYGYDTLLYNSNNQLVQILSYKSGLKEYDARFYYNTSADSVAFKIEVDELVGTTIYQNDKLQFTTNNIDNPACRLLWYGTFLDELAGLTDDQATSIPILFDNPSSNAQRFLPFFTKCVTGYQVYNNWGLENYKNSKFGYAYSADSLKFQAYTEKPAYPENVDYTFIKVSK